jgi:hypothetical protein
MRRTAVLTIAAVLWVSAVLAAGEARAQAQSRPKPVAPPVKSAPTAAPAAQQPPAPAVRPDAPSEATLGVPFYPSMVYIESYNAGAGQRYYLFGATASFADVVAYYKSVLKQRGELVFEEPATYQFDLGRFNEETMAFPPSVTVKDFTALGMQGYPNPKPNAQPARFRTIIQIVPIPAATPPSSVRR